MELELTTMAKRLLAKRGFDPVLGARPLRRTIQREIEDQLSEKILFGEVVPGQIVVGNGGTATAVTLGGYATINASGTLTIANNAITTAKIANSQITTGKLASGAVPTVIGGTSGISMTRNATSYIGMFSTANATESIVQVPIPTSGIVSNLDARVDAIARQISQAKNQAAAERKQLEQQQGQTATGGGAAQTAGGAGFGDNSNP